MEKADVRNPRFCGLRKIEPIIKKSGRTMSGAAAQLVCAQIFNWIGLTETFWGINRQTDRQTDRSSFYIDRLAKDPFFEQVKL